MELGKANIEKLVIHEVQRELLLPAEREEAWEAIADPERLGEWLGGEVEIDLVPGGELRIGERTGWVEEIVPGERLSFWWRRPDEDVATRVEISLEDAEDGTLVRVAESSPLATLDLIGIPLPSAQVRSTGAYRPPLALAFA
ncbi:MAG: SRPBCC family protein [Thermoleophilaceae bacterium]